MNLQDTPEYRRGFDMLCVVEGTDRPSIVEALEDVAPDLAALTIGFVYGEIYSRPQLGLRDRQLVTIAALAAMGNAQPQLKFHLGGALNVGCAAEELVEAMVHLAVYAGFPAALNGVFAVRALLQERGVTCSPAAAPTGERYARGWKKLQEIDGHAGEQVIASLMDIAPDLGRFIIEFGFGDIYARAGLSLLQRELITVAALSAMGTAAPQLRVHIHGLLNVGGTREMLVETITHIAAYAGFPAALNAMATAREVLRERG